MKQKAHDRTQETRRRRAVLISPAHHAILVGAKSGPGRYQGRSMESILDELLEFALRAKKVTVFEARP